MCAIVKVDTWAISWKISKKAHFRSYLYWHNNCFIPEVAVRIDDRAEGGVMNPVTVCNKRPIESVTGFGDFNGAFVKD